MKRQKEMVQAYRTISMCSLYNKGKADTDKTGADGSENSKEENDQPEKQA
jgi:hypothetical protein